MVTLTAPGTRTGASGAPWKGVDPTSVGRHWAVPRFLRHLLSDSETQDIKRALDELEAVGRIVWPQKKGGTPRLKQYIDEMSGVEPTKPLARYSTRQCTIIRADKLRNTETRCPSRKSNQIIEHRRRYSCRLLLRFRHDVGYGRKVGATMDRSRSGPFLRYTQPESD